MEKVEDAAREEGARKARPRSFFTRKIEDKLQEKGLEAPQRILSFLDQPFDTFGEAEKRFYEEKVKPLFDQFSSLLLEVFDQIGRPEEGWEESTKLMAECPAKVVAMLALYRFRRQTEEEDGPFKVLDQPEIPPPPATQARMSPQPANKRVIKPAAEKPKSKWWEKKIF